MIVCSVQPSRHHASETFIQAVTDRLPADVRVLRGPKALGRGLARDLQSHAADFGRRLLGRRRLERSAECYTDALARMAPDVVLAQYGALGALVAEACGVLGIPLVVCFRGYDATKSEVIQQWLDAYRQLFRQAAAVVAVAPTIRDSLICLGCPESKIEVNPSGADCDRFHGATPETNPAAFVAVGRFVPKKAPLATVRAFAAAWRSRPDLRLIMIGDGPLLPATRRLAETLGVGRAVQFLGAQPHASVASTMRRARALVQHSIVAPDGDSEGTPVSVMEAGACGLPVIATQHGGIPDVVLHGTTGLLSEEGDLGTMARHIALLAERPDLAGTMGRAARERVSGHFSVKRSLERLHAILVRAVQQSAAERPRPAEGDPRCAV